MKKKGIKKSKKKPAAMRMPGKDEGMMILPPSKAELMKRDEVTDQTIRDYLFGSTTKFTEQQQLLFIKTAVALQLNPFKREVYPVPYKNKDGTVELSIITGYEVYIKRAERSGKLNGWRVWTEGSTDELGKLKACIEIHRKGFDKPFYHEVFFREYTQGNFMWGSKPCTMIKKVVIGQGFRLAFSEELDGLPLIAEETRTEMEHFFEQQPTATAAEKIGAEPAPAALPAPAATEPAKPGKKATPKPAAAAEPEQARPEPAQQEPPINDNLLDLEVTEQGAIPVGKFKGTKYIELPLHYLIWLKDKVTNPGSVMKVAVKKAELKLAEYTNKLKAQPGDISFCVEKVAEGKRWFDLTIEQKNKVLQMLSDELHRREKLEKPA